MDHNNGENRDTCYPSPVEVRELSNNTRVAWVGVPPPDWNHFIVDDVDSIAAKRYLFRRAVDQIDLFDSAISQEMPLTYLTPAAAHYFIQGYIQYMLALDKHLGMSAKSCCDTPAIHLVRYLTSGWHPPYPEFSLEQIRCIVDLLLLVVMYPDFYCCDCIIASEIVDAVTRWEQEREGGVHNSTE